MFWFKLWHRVKSVFNGRDKAKSSDIDDDAINRTVVLPIQLIASRRPEPETSYGEVIL